MLQRMKLCSAEKIVTIGNSKYALPCPSNPGPEFYYSNAVFTFSQVFFACLLFFFSCKSKSDGRKEHIFLLLKLPFFPFMVNKCEG